MNRFGFALHHHAATTTGPFHVPPLAIRAVPVVAAVATARRQLEGPRARTPRKEWRGGTAGTDAASRTGAMVRGGVGTAST